MRWNQDWHQFKKTGKVYSIKLANMLEVKKLQNDI